MNDPVLRCPILRYMALGDEPRARTTVHSYDAPIPRSALAGFAAQAVAELIVWRLVDDTAGRSWSTRDFREWLTFSIASAVLLTALGGAVARRLRTTVAVMVGCLLAVALGCAVFIGDAVMHSA